MRKTLAQRCTALLLALLLIGTASVEVRADGSETAEIELPEMTTGDTLPFSRLTSEFASLAGGELEFVTGLMVPTDQGTLYYNYKSEDEPGAGVGQNENYYRSPGPGQRALSGVTFAPKSDYSGGRVTISGTAVAKEENYPCVITFMLRPGSGGGSGSGLVEGIGLSTPYDTPVRLDSAEFDRVFQDQGGLGVDTVTFSQPSSRQGTLYTDYVAPDNYGSEVSTSHAYTRRELDDIWFVPAPGFAGTVTIPYVARERGTGGGIHIDELTITVGRRSVIESGGPAYSTGSGSPVTFDDWDFDSYRAQVLSWGRTLSYIRFDSLPSASEGILYYDYRSSSLGARVEVGENYYYGSRNPRIDRLTFVPTEGFSGTVHIPFTGWDGGGRSFSGEVEIAVRGSSGRGDIRYTCAPGRSVSFLTSDFTGLCRSLTGRTLNYIILRDLPDRYSDGSLYHGNSRVGSTSTRYYANTTGAYRINRLSFEADSGFSGSTDIPFVGYASNGDTFDGIITISSGGSGSSGSSSWGNIRYRTDSGRAVVFSRDDFSDLSRWETGRDVSSVRFQAPSSIWGDLYRNYRSSSDMGTRITSSASISRSGLDQVAFVPVRGYSGTVYIDFTATSGDGSTFRGTVEIVVERGTWNIPTTVPVWFSDVAASAYYADPVRWAVENGITSGTSSTTFSPERTCTIAQILSFLYRANGSPRVTGSNPFTDVRTSDYYYEAALWARQKGLISGSALNPNRPCTRGMVVTYLWKLAGQPAPAARPISYAPYTLSGNYEYKDYDEQRGEYVNLRAPYTLRFNDAVTSRTRVTLHTDSNVGDHIDRDVASPKTYDVTLIAIRPGSGFTINGKSEDDYGADVETTWLDGVPASLYFRASDGSFRYTVTSEYYGGSDYTIYPNIFSWYRENGHQESESGNNYSADCGVLIRLDGNYYFVTYADSAIAAGLMAGSAGFSDVPDSASYAQAVAWATEQKITSGTSKTTFSPDKTCTRGQIATFLYRAMGW